MVPIRKSKRILEIDSLRGIAALLVIWLHVAEIFNRVPTISANGTGWYDILHWIDFGRLGVSIFFAISGFVICASIKGDRATGTKRFAIRRLFRLYPAFWVSIILGILIVWIGQNRSIDASLILANWTMIPALLGEQPILGLYWTLELELVFYALVALLFVLGLLRNVLVVFQLAILGIGIFCLFFIIPEWRPAYGPWATTPFHLAIMFWGVLFRYWYDGRPKIQVANIQFSIKQLLITLTILICLVPIAAILNCIRVNDFEFFNDSTAYLLALLIFTMGTIKFPVRWRPLVWLGTISYSLYLLHPIVFVILRNYLLKIPSWGFSLHLSVYILLTMVLTVGLAAIVYYFIEKPAINLSYKLTKKYKNIDLKSEEVQKI